MNLGNLDRASEEDKFLALEMKYKQLLEQNHNLVINEINNVKFSLNSLINELNSVKSQIKEQQQTIQIREKNQPEKAEMQERAENREAKKDFHPKQGNFKPEDVSVEKFFYFGEK